MSAEKIRITKDELKVLLAALQMSGGDDLDQFTDLSDLKANRAYCSVQSKLFDLEGKRHKQIEYAKQSKQEEVKYCWASNCNGRIIDGSCENCDPKPQPQEKVDEQMIKNQMRLDGWIGWLQARIPELKKGANEFWIKQALESYKDAHLANTLQDKGLREAAEKVVMYWYEKIKNPNSFAKEVRFNKALHTLEKALK